MKFSIYLSLFSIFLSISLNGQVINSQKIEKGTSIQRNTLFNLEELKVRWKKAALENCPGVPCITNTVAGAPTGVVATAGVSSASVTFVAPSSNGGSVITGYTVTSSPTGGTATGPSSPPLTVMGLTNGTAYTFTVIATNAVGNSIPSAASTAVTPAAPFVCGTSTITDFDGNPYSTVSIGAQCWTTTNLKVTKYNDGTLIPDYTTSTSNPWAPASGARTGYDVSVVSLSDYIGTFGYLYNWYAATDSRKLCPDGWHVPTDAEWTTLIIHLDAAAAAIAAVQSTTAGTVMKSAVTNTTAGSGLGWDPASPVSDGTNTSGFTALPGGRRILDGSFQSFRNLAFFVSATAVDTNNAWFRILTSINGNVNRNGNIYGLYNKAAGGSVRCLKD